MVAQNTGASLAAPAQTKPDNRPNDNREYLTWDSQSRPLTISLRANLAAALSRATPEKPIDGVLLGRIVPGPRPQVQIDLCLPVDSGYFYEDVRHADSIGHIVANF